VTKQGLAAIVATRGNKDSHVILRGGSDGPNFSPEHVKTVTDKLESAGLSPRLMVDCSHANSGKDPARQPAVAAALGEQIASSKTGIAGVMIESFLVAGRQNHTPGCELVYGQSITDGCLEWDTTVEVLEGLAESVRKRKAL
jgi:3-deoxy-7-phosphoheptulonate synthase